MKQPKDSKPRLVDLRNVPNILMALGFVALCWQVPSCMARSMEAEEQTKRLQLEKNLCRDMWGELKPCSTPTTK